LDSIPDILSAPTDNSNISKEIISEVLEIQRTVDFVLDLLITEREADEIISLINSKLEKNPNIPLDERFIRNFFS
jgi:hypothetical protein